MKKKEIIIIEDSSKVDFGGGQQITLYLAKYLQASGSQMYFVDYTSTSRYICDVIKIYGASRVITLKSACHKRTILPKILNRLLEVVILKSYFKQNYQALCQRLPEEKKNILVYVAAKKGLTLAHKLYKQYGIPYYFHSHLVENKTGLQYKFLFPYLQDAAKIICPSKEAYNSLGCLPNSIVQYNPITKSLPSTVNKQKKRGTPFVVAYIGSLMPIKGVAYFIEAAQALQSSDYEFRIYGDGYLRQTLENKSGGSVRFMGFSTDILTEMQENVDLVVLPTIIPEALPTVIVDAKLLGIPVITTNIGGQAEIVSHMQDGILVDIKNSDQIVESIHLLKEDSELYTELSTQAKNSVGKFAPSEYEKFLKELFYE